MYENCSRLDFCCAAAALATLELISFIKVTGQVPESVTATSTLKKEFESKFYPNWTGSRMADTVDMQTYVNPKKLTCPNCKKKIARQAWKFHKCQHYLWSLESGRRDVRIGCPPRPFRESLRSARERALLCSRAERNCNGQLGL